MKRGLARRTVISGTAVLTAGVLALSGGGTALADGGTAPTASAPGVSAPGGPGVPAASRTAPARAAAGQDDPAPADPDGPAARPAAADPDDEPAPGGSRPTADDPGAGGPAPAGPAAGAPGPAAEPGAPADDPDAPAADDPAADDPAADDPTAGDPAAGDPAADDPVTGPAGPAAADPEAPGDTADEPADPTDADATTAAQRHGWGTPLPASDEFDYTGRPDPARWNTAGECWPGHAGNGGRCASRTTVKDGKMIQTGLANGNSAWVASTFNQQYGRWEARVRSEGNGPANGRQYHPLLIVWPKSDRWPEDGEYDFLENMRPGDDCAQAFIHYPHGRGPVQQEFVREKDCGAPLSEWHNVAFEWTPDHVKGFIDGEEWFSFSGGARGNRRNIQDMPSGHLTIQLDNFHGGNMQPATYEIEWVRIYSLDD